MLKAIKENKTACMFLLAVVVTLFGCGLLLTGFIVAPLGVIDSSVIVSTGEVLTFAGSVLGINCISKKKKDETLQSD